MPEIHQPDDNGRDGDPDIGTAAAALAAEAEGIALPSSNVLTLREVARWMRVNPVTVYQLALRNEIPYFRAGRNFRFRRDDLEEWSRTHRPTYKNGPRKRRSRVA